MSSASGRTSYDSSLPESEDLFQTLPSELDEALVFLFEAHSIDPCLTLEEISGDESSPVGAFLSSTTRALVKVLSRLPARERAWFGSPPTHDSILGLCQTKLENPAISTVQNCIAQHAHLIRYAELHTSRLFGRRRKFVLAAGLGMLAATTLSSCQSIDELLSTSREMVLLSLRLGVDAAHIMNDLDPSPASWTLTMDATCPSSIQQDLENFNQDEVCSSVSTDHALADDKQRLAVHHRISVSHVSRRCMRITGPPSRLRCFLQSNPEFKRASAVITPPSLPWSTPFMEILNVDHVLGESSAFDFPAQLNACFLANGAERLVDCVTTRDVLRHVLHYAACRPTTSRVSASMLSPILDTHSVKLVPLGYHLSFATLVDDLMDELGQSRNLTVETFDATHKCNARDNNGYAIVGMTIRCPGADSLEGFWNLLMNGEEKHQKIPSNRFDIGTHCDPEGKTINKTVSPWGCFIDQLGLFDNRLFNLSPREAAQIDPAQRLILLTVHEALDAAGYYRDRTPSTHHSRIGTFFGATGDDYREANSGQKIDFAYVTGGVRAFGPGRVNYHFKFDGPSYSIDTACSASAASIQLAIASLKAGDCDTAIAGGANVLTASDMYAGLSRGNFLSPTGSCKTFLEAADGYCRAEGAGCVIIKRLSDALADNDNIQAVISACATNHSSRATSIVQPHRESQEALFRELLTKSRLTPDDISFVEMHGTGTQKGDAVESASVSNVFLKDRKPWSRPLHLGSIKPNVGHAEAASGVCSLIKTVLMLKNNYIPPVPNVEQTLNTNLPSSFAQAIPQKAIPFRDVHRHLLVNNFGATGGNTSMIVEDAPCVGPKQRDPRSHFVVAVSAKTENSLKENLARLLEFAKLHPSLKYEDLGYTTTARRQHHPLRRAFSISSLTEAIQALSASLRSLEHVALPRPSKLIFVFEGQGGSYPCMGSDLFKTSPTFASSLRRSDRLCQALGFPSFLADLDTGSPEVNPLRDQLALAATEIALYDLWLSWGLEPAAVLGHSLGEYPALYASGALTLSDMFYLLGRRGRILQKRCIAYSHSMIIVHINEADCCALIEKSGVDGCEISCFNGKSAVVSGLNDSIARLALYIRSIGVKSSSMSVPFAFHSSQMDIILEELGQEIEATLLRPVGIPLASTVTGTILLPGESIPRNYLNDQCRNPVLFSEATKALLKTMKANEEPIWVGIGPSSACLSMIESSLRVDRQRLLPSLSKREPGWKTLTRATASLFQSGMDIDWPAHHRDYEQGLSLLGLPTYAFDMTKHWIKYEGDWMVRKGRSHHSSTAETLSPLGALHKVTSRNVQGNTVSITLSTDLLQHQMKELINGHRVNGNAMCSSTVYADMAFAAAQHAFQLRAPGQNTPIFSLDNLSISKPLILDPTVPSATMHVTAQAVAGFAQVQIQFRSTQGLKEEKHGHCVAVIGDVADWQRTWRRTSHLIQSRMDTIRGGQSSALSVNHLRRSMVYKLFGSLVEYSAKYQGLEEVFLESDLFEAVGRVRFQTEPGEDAMFSQCPYWLDSILHLSGFALNASSSTSSQVVFIAHGWKSLKIAKRLEASRTYHCYVQMIPDEKQGRSSMSGDVYAFDGDEIVAVGEGLTFQSLKRSILRQALPAPGTPTYSLDMPSDTTAQAYSSRTPDDRPRNRPSPEKPKTFAHLAQLLSKETGVPLKELEKGTSFADVGIDSLLSLSLIDSIAEAGFTNLPRNMFIKHEVLDDLKVYFETSGLEPIERQSHGEDPKRLGEVREASKSSVTDIDGGSAGVAGKGPDILPNEASADLAPDSLQPEDSLADASFSQRPSMAQGKHGGPVLLQESILPAAESTTLFLLPDGSGSASSYAALVPFDTATNVYGLNAPAPSELDPSATESVESRAAYFTRHIRATQPEGPYTLGGWSVGGSYAFECTRELLEEGEQVAQLVLIDAPCFAVVPQMSRREIDVMSELGVFGSRGPHPAVLAAFERTMAALRPYVPTPLPPRAAGVRATLIWARRGVLETCREQDAAAAAKADCPADSWVLHPRRPDGRERQGWAELLPGARHADADGDHFSMMRPPHVRALGAAVKAALDASGPR